MAATRTRSPALGQVGPVEDDREREFDIIRATL